MKSSAAVLRWNWDFSSLGAEESSSFPSPNSMFPKWRMAATTLNIASCKTCQNECKQNCSSSAKILNWLLGKPWTYLLISTHAYNTHSSSGFRVFFSVIHPIKFNAIRLVEIVKWSSLSQFIFFTYLTVIFTWQSQRLIHYIWFMVKQSNLQRLPNVKHQKAHQRMQKITNMLLI